MYHIYELSCEKCEQTYAYERIVLMNEDCPITIRNCDCQERGLFLDVTILRDVRRSLLEFRIEK